MVVDIYIYNGPRKGVFQGLELALNPKPIGPSFVFSCGWLFIFPFWGAAIEDGPWNIIGHAKRDDDFGNLPYRIPALTSSGLRA